MLGSFDGGALPTPPVVDDGAWPVDVEGVEAGFVEPPVAAGEAKPVGPKRSPAGKPPLNKYKNYFFLSKYFINKFTLEKD